MMYELAFTQEQLLLIDRALCALPYGQVAPLIQSINDQLKAKEQPEKADE